MRASITSAVVVTAIGLLAAGGVRLGAHEGSPEPAAPQAPSPTAATTSDPREAQREFDLEQEALALLPNGTTVSGGQSTRERRCLDDGDYEPCAEFSVDAFGPGSDRRPSYERRALESGWRVLRFDPEPNGGALTLTHGRLRAQIMLSSYGYDRIRVSDPTRRRPLVEPVAVDARSASAARAPFVAAAGRACTRLKKTVASAPAAGQSSDEMFRKLRAAFEAFVAEVGRLPVPRGDERAVQRMRTELRNYARVLRMLETAEEEQALAAAAAIAVQGNRAEDAMQQYGLRTCKGITGVQTR